MLDSIEQSMTQVHDDKESELPNVVCVAAQATLLLINKYYTLMKDCELYNIAIGNFMHLYADNIQSCVLTRN